MLNVMAKPWHGRSSRSWQSPSVNKRFVFEVRTTASPETFALPLEAGGSYDFFIDWGDGNSDSITAWNAAAVTHTYASAGTYIVSVSGVIQGWRFNNAGDKTKIYDIKSWGPLRLGNSNGYFYGCSNLTVSATDILDTSSIVDFSYAFRNCSSLTFLGVDNWDISSFTTFSNAFRNCSSLINLVVGSWNTIAVTSFHSAFYGCSSLIALDVSSWDTSNVTTFVYTFRDCTSLTTLALDNWNITAVTTMASMLISDTLTTANYSNILIAFEAQAVLNNVPFHGGNSKYSVGAAATARAALIADHSWTITDGGQE
jgi:surface protein